MYRIEYRHSRPRIIAKECLSADDFARIGIELAEVPRRARKVGYVAARQAIRHEYVETRWNGRETGNEAGPGDWIVTSLAIDGSPLSDDDGQRNVYVISGNRFDALYEPMRELERTGDGDIFKPRGYVKALRLSGGFEITAPWGEPQRADDGWLLLSFGDVYGNHHDTFAATYELLD